MMNDDLTKAKNLSESGMYGVECETPSGLRFIIFKEDYAYIKGEKERQEILDWIASSGDGSPFALVGEWHEQDHQGNWIWSHHFPSSTHDDIKTFVQGALLNEAPWQFYAFG